MYLGMYVYTYLCTQLCLSMYVCMSVCMCASMYVCMKNLPAVVAAFVVVIIDICSAAFQRQLTQSLGRLI